MEGQQLLLKADGRVVAVGADHRGAGGVSIFRFRNNIKSWTQKGQSLEGSAVGDEAGRVGPWR